MAKRKAKARTRKAGRKTRLRAKGATARRTKSRRSSQKASGERRRTKSRQSSQKSAKRRRTKRATRKISRPARQAASRKRPPKRKAAARPKPAALSRERRRLRDVETSPGAPSSLNFAGKASAAESGQQMYHQRAREHTEGGSALTSGEVDSDWNDAYSSGEETPGGDMSTPDQDVVEEIGRALGVEYEDAEELKGSEKIESRDRNRWEYDPASAEDYKDRNRKD
jgi:hypothetical protein